MFSKTLINIKGYHVLLMISLFILAVNKVGYSQIDIPYPIIQGQLKELFAGPAIPEEKEHWVNGLKEWKERMLDSLKFSDVEYTRRELSWSRKPLIFAQMMAHDRFFYDIIENKYTVDRFLNDLKIRYGGIDAVLIWPTYPNMGIDDRNQYDLLHDMPGGISSLKNMVDEFHKSGIKVLFPIMKWDNGTRPVSSSMPINIVKEMKEIGADGLNGDTFFGVTEDYKVAYENLKFPLVLQSEVAIRDLKMVEWNLWSWGYFWPYTYIPGVSIYKWLDSRHQVQVTNRWARDRNDDIQYAFFNGIGYNTWENIWGTWNQVSKRDGEAVRRIGEIYRQFPDAWSSSEWEPFFPVLTDGVFCSKFPRGNKTIYTFINRDSIDHLKTRIKIPLEKNYIYFDIWRGRAVEGEKDLNEDSITFEFPMEANGYGAFLGIRKNSVNDTLLLFLRRMADVSKKSLQEYSKDWNSLSQTMYISKNVNSKAANKEGPPDGMVRIPEAREYLFESEGIMIEGDPLANAVGIQYPWEDTPGRVTKHKMSIKSFYIDKYPVTNKQFKEFLEATNYYPKDNHNFLKDWKGIRNYPKGWDNKPVTWISIEDARAYAGWAGKRLPHEWEWQYAAQGRDGRKYPWGETLDLTKIPPLDSSRNMRSPTSVNDFHQGASPFGVEDLVGNVWQWTDEYRDEHTRFAVVKGGGYYRPVGSHWYFPRTVEVNKYGKYLLMAPSIDRSGSIGFRCVKEIK